MVRDTYGWATGEPNAVLSYLSDLGDRGHPSKTIEAHLGTLRALRAIDNTPLSDAEVKACHLVIRHRAGEEADDPLMEPGPLQADAVDLGELRLMVGKLDRTTARGKRDAATMIVDWWMARRASEPARLNLHDVKITTVKVEDATGKKVPRKALIIKIRRSKADQEARGQEVRILAQDDQDICPVHAGQEWLDVLADDGQLAPGPFLRRIDRHGNIGAKAAGRHTKDPARRGGITADTVNDIIKAAARAAELTPAPAPEELAAASRAKEEAYAAADAAPTAEEANAILKAWRTSQARCPRGRAPHHRPLDATRLHPDPARRRNPTRGRRPALAPLPAVKRVRRLPQEEDPLEPEPDHLPEPGGLSGASMTWFSTTAH
ncbi:hypothetical protein ABZ370_43860 [Streptomyces sp. NPDC005962]|uniref:hypothetical protein n=1 Tax=Streptomyces sp. NPDC005962 TaxID=3154466 RepID=UPI0033D8A8AD